MVVENFAFAQQQSQVENQIKEAHMAVVANDYLMKRYPSQRRIRQIRKGQEEPPDPLLVMSSGNAIVSAANSREDSRANSSRRQSPHSSIHHGVGGKAVGGKRFSMNV